VDSRGHYNSAFYNSQDKPTTGSTLWATRSVVLDVDNEAEVISFGLISGGGGTAWMRNLRMEEVGRDVPVDRLPDAAAQMNKEPVL